MNGQTWTGIIEDATGHAVIRGDELINDSITGRSFTVAEIELSAGCRLFEAIMFERNGGAFFELLGRGVSPSGVPDPDWHLLKAGGAQVRGLQLVP
jgi:hypothetical protein